MILDTVINLTKEDEIVSCSISSSTTKGKLIITLVEDNGGSSAA